MHIVDNIDLTSFNSYRLHAIARRAYFPENKTDLVNVFDHYCKEKVAIIGGGNNIILNRRHYNDLDFVFLSPELSAWRVEHNCVTALCGIHLRKVSQIALEYALGGLESFSDIPGTLGGAVFMNAGAYGEDIASLLVSVTIFEISSLSFKEIAAESIQWSYRYSSLQDWPNCIAWSATLRLVERNPEIIRAKMEKTEERRFQAQPRSLPNAGSVFKKPQCGLSVGEMIQALGMKGISRGGAKISDKHGGFIVNHDNAHAEDILYLIDLMQEAVLQEFGVELELEQHIIK